MTERRRSLVTDTPDRRRLRHVERAGAVDREHLVPVTRRSVEHQLVDGYASVVDEDVQPAVLGYDLVEDALAVVAVRDIALGVEAPARGRPHGEDMVPVVVRDAVAISTSDSGTGPITYCCTSRRVLGMSVTSAYVRAAVFRICTTTYA